MKFLDIKKVKINEEDYPNLLKYINEPPKELYYRGNIKLANKASIAIVGARKASDYGKWAAYNLAVKLAEYDIVTVSGMAYGIDTFAHKGALENEGKTIAVLGCGVDICYPVSNQNLMERISKNGLILSEFEPGAKPLPYRFPLRNRIISGISIGTIVAEAGLNSGSLITAEYAAEQGRNIYAVPGNINNMNSIGSNKLIKDGATPIIVIDDIIDELCIERKSIDEKDKLLLGEDEKLFYEILLQNGEVTSDFLCRTTGKSVSEVNSIITILEIKGIIQTALGKIFVAK
ncbi:DNA-processing protein DprA [Anaerovorax odorimutans]|uniref:DNA-processing protein DprA n=1 Tax=Anaerovorax odorimutans TaxID=109327 RepID=UPI0004004B33|nr:DNA-processing protein DprA [Anaerovorax odorimutans]